MSAGSSRSGISLTGKLMHSYKRNQQNHKTFVEKEFSNDINRKNERLFLRLQEIHSVSVPPPLTETVALTVIDLFAEEEEGPVADPHPVPRSHINQ